MNEDISKIISKHKMYMSFDGNEYEMVQKVELNKIFEEIERLNNKVDELMELYTTERHCKEDYKSIIKEAREYIEQHRIQNKYSYEYDLFQRNTRVSELLEILDKGE